MAYYHQPCDSYFVEHHDRRLQLETREHERQAKKHVQIALAEQLSDLASLEYRDDHLCQMEQMEIDTLPDIASIDIQTEIQWYMRPYLLDFLIEAHAAFGLLPETLFLTINLLDRYCSKRIVYKKHYQLVGCSALLIASKYGDRKERVPSLKELKGMCCSLYEEDMFVQMEWHVLQTLNWSIGHPTVDNFLQLAVEHSPYDPEVEHMACYLAEMAMFQRDFVGKRASDMARSSLALARCILGRAQEPSDSWAGQFSSQTLLALSQQMHRSSTILSRKYASAHLSRVSILLDDFLARQAALEQYNASPPTPPSADLEEPNTFANISSTPPGFGKTNMCPTPITPVKPQAFMAGSTAYPYGCPTPPDTPTNEEYFAYKPSTTSTMPTSCYRPPTPSSQAQSRLPSRNSSASIAAVGITLPPLQRVAY